MSDDDFMEIISKNDLERLQLESELYNLTIRDLIIGMRDLSQSVVIISDFIDTYFLSLDEDNEVERPALLPEHIVFAKDMFENAKKFTASLMDYEFEDDEFDDEDDDDEDYEDDEEEDDDDDDN